MKHAILVPVFLLLAVPASAQNAADPTNEILALERQVMDGWQKGNPGPALAASHPQITLIHEAIGQRLDGLPAVKALYERQGTPLFEKYEIQEPKVQAAGDVAILTYRLEESADGSTRYWNGTEVFWRTKEGWRIVHSHWSAAKTQ